MLEKQITEEAVAQIQSDDGLQQAKVLVVGQNELRICMQGVLVQIYQFWIVLGTRNLTKKHTHKQKMNKTKSKIKEKL